MLRRIQLLSLLVFALFTLSACSISFESSGSANTRTNGGVYKSGTSGETWRQTTGIATVGNKTLTFSNENVITLAIDPQDNKAVYVGTESGGMIFSYDAGSTWQVAHNLGKRKIQAIAISPINKCVIFTASANKIFKSTDCNRNWDEIYFDNNTAISINSIAFDPTNENTIYAGTSRGEIIVSVNGGKSWTVLNRFDDSKKSNDNIVTKVVVNEKNSNIIWVTTSGSGVYRSDNRGKTWQGFMEEFAEIHTNNANKINDIALSQSDGKVVIIATDAGLIRSFDNGTHWQLIDLIPPSGKTVINRVAIFKKDQKRIYYTTDTSFGWSEDGGTTWSSKKLPTSRRGISLIVDEVNPDVVYLGVKAVVEN